MEKGVNTFKRNFVKFSKNLCIPIAKCQTFSSAYILFGDDQVQSEEETEEDARNIWQAEWGKSGM